GHGGAPSVTGMDITIYSTFLPADDPEASLVFYRDVLGFEVRNDVGRGRMRWITVGAPDQPGTSIVLHPPAVDPGITDEERRTIVEMSTRASYAPILMGSKDVYGAFSAIGSGGAEIVQEPIDQPYGVRDLA